MIRASGTTFNHIHQKKNHTLLVKGHCMDQAQIFHSTWSNPQKSRSHRQSKLPLLYSGWHLGPIKHFLSASSRATGLLKQRVISSHLSNTQTVTFLIKTSDNCLKNPRFLTMCRLPSTFLWSAKEILRRPDEFLWRYPSSLIFVKSTGYSTVVWHTATKYNQFTCTSYLTIVHGLSYCHYKKIAITTADTAFWLLLWVPKSHEKSAPVCIIAKNRGLATAERFQWIIAMGNSAGIIEKNTKKLCKIVLMCTSMKKVGNT